MGRAFLTGSTGFVGSAVLKALVTDTDLDKFYLLVRDKESAKDRLMGLIRVAKNFSKEIYLFEGDITKENFGLSEEEVSLLNKVKEVYHIAARISLSGNNQEKIFKTNVDGTRNLLDVFKDAKNLKNIFYFSTAYVCGKQNQIIKEEWLEKPSEFRNHYEESKWLTEELIQQYIKDFKVPITVLRPTIVGTEDKSKFRGLKRQTIYLHGNIIRKATKSQEEDKPIRLIGKSDTFINLITIEDIVKILLKIRSLKEKSLIYNLANPNNCLAMSFLEGLQEVIGFKSGYSFVEDLDVKKLSEAERSIFEKTKSYFAYSIDSHLRWDTFNTNKIREELNLLPKNDGWIRNNAKDFFLIIENEE